MPMTRDTFDRDCAAGQADLIEARLGWLTIRAGDVLSRRRLVWSTADGRVVPGWAVHHHWGSAFVPVGYQPPAFKTLLERRAAFLSHRRRIRT